MLELDRHFDPAYGEPVELAPGIARVTANNPSPYTFHGTNTYLIGHDTLAVVDPGPADPAHLAALLAAARGRPISHIFVSHRHLDHSSLATDLSRQTGAPVRAAPSRPRSNVGPDGSSAPDAEVDAAFLPDHALDDGEVVQGDGWAVECVLTPGHASDHACFALPGSEILLSADHVMSWSTTVVAPPDGSMSQYMTSLDRLIERGDRLLLPGHGGPVVSPKTFLPALKAHRLQREQAILKRLRHGDRTVAQLVAAIYPDLDPSLHHAASLSVLAHLEDLVARGLAVTSGPAALDGDYGVVSSA